MRRLLRSTAPKIRLKTKSVFGSAKTGITVEHLPPSDAGGNAFAPVPLPYLPALLGLEVVGQWFVIDAGLTDPLPLATSPGALIHIGN